MIYYDKQTDGIRVVVWHVTEEYEELLSMLPDAVFYIEITADNKIVGAVPIQTRNN